MNLSAIDGPTSFSIYKRKSEMAQRPKLGSSMSAAMTIHPAYHHNCHKLLLNQYRIASCRFFASIARARAGRTMASSGAGEFNTITERVRFDKEIKKSKFIAIAGHVSDDQSAHSFLSQVRDPRATHNCWAYKIGEQYRSNDDGEPSGTAGKPIYTAIASSGIDRVMVVVIRYFGGIKLGTGGLVRAYGGVAAECLRNAPTHLVKSKLRMGIEISFDLLGILYHQLQSFDVEDMKQDYDTGKENTCMVTFKVEYDQVDKLEETVRSNCCRDIVFYKQ